MQAAKKKLLKNQCVKKDRKSARSDDLLYSKKSERTGSGTSAVTIPAQYAAFAAFDEFEKLADFRKVRHFSTGFRDRIAHAAAVTEEDVIKVFDRTDRFRAESVTAHPHDIEPADPAVTTVTDHERRQIHGNRGTAGEDSHTSHATELVHTGQAGDQTFVADLTISGDTAVGNHDHTVPQHAVV